jgi:hypothetical protein
VTGNVEVKGTLSKRLRLGDGNRHLLKSGAMETLPEALGRRLGDESLTGAQAVEQPPPESYGARRLALSRPRLGERALSATQVALLVYAASRLLYLVIALLDLLRHWGLAIPTAELYSPGLVPSVEALAHPQLIRELTNWDGVWYVNTALHWYPHTAIHWQTTLGFLPLYPMLIWLLSHVLFVSAGVAGVLVSLAGGAVATVLVQRLAQRWWGEAASRRAVLFFCFFPGSIVFSMAYSEGLAIPLIAGCLLALSDRRWVLAGLAAGFATAVEPAALAVIPACAVACIAELRGRLTDRRAWRSLAAPLLSPLGIAGFGIFLWAWTGTPLASYDTQRYSPGWSESSSVLALWHMTERMFTELLDFSNPRYPLNINLNYENGVLGALFLAFALWLIFAKLRPRMPAAAIAFTLAIAALTFTSANTPPNPRMLIVAFPALIAVAAWARGRWFIRFMAIELAITLACSPFVFVNVTLRP